METATAVFAQRVADVARQRLKTAFQATRRLRDRLRLEFSGEVF